MLSLCEEQASYAYGGWEGTDRRISSLSYPITKGTRGIFGGALFVELCGG